MARSPVRNTLLCIVGLDALAYGLVVPVLPEVVGRFAADPATAAKLFGLYGTVGAVVGLLAAPALGALADHFGRRSILKIGCVGTAVDLGLLAWAPNLTALFLGRVIAGLTGATAAATHAAMADVTAPETRSRHFARLGTAVGVGIVAGPIAGGALAAGGGGVPFLVAAAVSLANLGLVWFALPETLPTHTRGPLDGRRLDPLRALWPLFRRTPLTRLFWSALLVYLAGRAVASTWALLAAQRFGWSAVTIGSSFAAMGLMAIVAQGAIAPFLEKRIGAERTLTVGLWWSASSAVALAVAVAFAFPGTTGTGARDATLHTLASAAALSSIVAPLLHARISNAVPSDAQGELQGSLAAIARLSAVAAPALYTQTLAPALGGTSSATGLLAGAPFLLGAALSVLAVLLLRGRRDAPAVVVTRAVTPRAPTCPSSRPTRAPGGPPGPDRTGTS